MYYVYEWIRMDTNEPFYVGKGKDDRAYNLKKNKMFMDIINYCENNNIEYYVNILVDNLTEQEAFGIECWYIHEYMINFGYKLANMTWGGEGGNSFSLMNEEDKKQYREKMRQKLLGKNTGKRDLEIGKKISKTKLERGIAKGNNNPMYGKTCKEFMTEEAIERWKKNIAKSAGKANRKPIRSILNGEVKIFNSRKECIDYYYKLGISSNYIKHLIKTKEAFNPQVKKEQFKYRGLRIEYIEETLK